MGIKIAVIGSGIIGLSSALRIQKEFSDIEITLISDKFSPETTSDGAAGLWGPFLLSNTLEHLIDKWSKLTHDYLLKLWQTQIGGEVGISMISFIRVSNKNDSEPFWKNTVFGYRELKNIELEKLNLDPNLKQGFSFVTFTCEGKMILPYFYKLFVQNGGKVLKKPVRNFNDLQAEFDIVVNCTGLGSHFLVGDPLVQPIRGQVQKMDASWIKIGFLDDSDDGNYVIPNQNVIVCGGTHQKGDWNQSANAEDSLFIKNGCEKIYPSLKNGKLLYEWVGLRPGREEVKIELEKREIKGEKPFYIIHNFGHGGAGLTLFYGCAIDCANLVKNAILDLQNNNLISAKL